MISNKQPITIVKIVYLLSKHLWVYGLISILTYAFYPSSLKLLPVIGKGIK